jgi:ABC-type transport system involved in multi-copper enzyme maturation permease subunit
MKALLWKEWRENWVILVMAIGVICLLAYLLEINREFNPGFNDVKVVFFFIPLFIAIITANLFSTEFGHNTMSFLLTQPISRSKLWLTKVGFGVFVVFLLILGSILGVYYISRLTPHPIQFDELLYVSTKDQIAVIMSLCLLGFQNLTQQYS